MLMVMIMNKKDLWLIFTKTGKVEDYLNYKNFEDEINAKKDLYVIILTVINFAQVVQKYSIA